MYFAKAGLEQNIHDKKDHLFGKSSIVDGRIDSAAMSDLIEIAKLRDKKNHVSFGVTSINEYKLLVEII
jgi:hypothetical protein